MYEILIVIHAIVTLALIIIILVQRSSSDGMGLSGGSSNSFMSGRTAANFLTRTTSLLAGVFILLSLGIGVLTAHNNATNSSVILDKIENRKTESVTKKPVTVPRPE